MVRLSGGSSAPGTIQSEGNSDEMFWKPEMFWKGKENLSSGSHGVLGEKEEGSIL